VCDDRWAGRAIPRVSGTSAGVRRSGIFLAAETDGWQAERQIMICWSMRGRSALRRGSVSGYDDFLWETTASTR
jgi:hypothetical protein